MATNLGIKLNKLIKKHAYLGGTLLLQQKKAEEQRIIYEAALADVNEVNDQRAELERQIEELSAIDPADIRKIKQTPRKTGMPHGTLTRELIRVLQSQDGPVSTGDLVQHVVNLYGYPYNSVAERRGTRNAVISPLSLFSKRGAVIRLPALEGSRQGRWQWIQHTTDNQP